MASAMALARSSGGALRSSTTLIGPLSENSAIWQGSVQPKNRAAVVVAIAAAARGAPTPELAAHTPRWIRTQVASARAGSASNKGAPEEGRRADGPGPRDRPPIRRKRSPVRPRGPSRGRSRCSPARRRDRFVRSHIWAPSKQSPQSRRCIRSTRAPQRGRSACVPDCAPRRASSIRTASSHPQARRFAGKGARARAPVPRDVERAAPPVPVQDGPTDQVTESGANRRSSAVEGHPARLRPSGARRSISAGARVAKLASPTPTAARAAINDAVVRARPDATVAALQMATPAAMSIDAAPSRAIRHAPKTRLVEYPIRIRSRQQTGPRDWTGADRLAEGRGRRTGHSGQGS